jgi:hypothetical protein
VADALSVMSASSGSAISPISEPKNDAVDAAQIQRKFRFAQAFGDAARSGVTAS